MHTPPTRRLSFAPAAGTQQSAATNRAPGSVGFNLSKTAGFNLFNLSGYPLHEWSREHKFTEELELDLEPGDIAWLETRSPPMRVTGDFTITTGNTTWLLKGVTFDSLDSDVKNDRHEVAHERGGLTKIIPAER